MSDSIVLAQDLPWPPKVDDFFLDGLFGLDNWLTKFTLMVWLAVIVLIVLFTRAMRKPALVPTRGQWFAESVYGFVRDSIGKEIIGKDAHRFVPYLTVLFCFVAFTNIYGIIPLAQISPNTHYAFPLTLALISYIMFNWVGIKKKGAARHFKDMIYLPDAPMWLQPLLIPIEFISNLVVRPVTLSVRLFANMFAGHLILLVFTVGGFMLLGADNFALKGVSVVSFLLAIAMTLFEAFVAILQAYIFVLLSATYIEGALAEEH
ncbi:F0F1 ATP synthase subunit A [Longispora albida]|uniref:F0F1 ATP synthase subunit A n=1 Tax=Longispora albida TaxID=203523 RepID=UPI00038268E1|nr:F0F1 ATP synthase subunit A [Longispora albida]